MPAVVAAIALERVAELWLARRNAAWAFARGAVEVGQRDYRTMAVFHALFLAACVVEPILLDRSFTAWIAGVCIALLLGAQALRWWSIRTLGPRWNTRIIVLPGAAPVTGGPYRWLRHPNYTAVIVEMVALPMVQGAWLTALLATVGNALILRVRVRQEEQALSASWAQAFAATPRFVPGATDARA